MSEPRPVAVVRPLDADEKWIRDAEYDDVFALDLPVGCSPPQTINAGLGCGVPDKPKQRAA